MSDRFDHYLNGQVRRLGGAKQCLTVICSDVGLPYVSTTCTHSSTSYCDCPELMLVVDNLGTHELIDIE